MTTVDERGWFNNGNGITVAELIEMLQKEDPSMEVRICTWREYCSENGCDWSEHEEPITFIDYSSDAGRVYLTLNG